MPRQGHQLLFESVDALCRRAVQRRAGQSRALPPRRADEAHHCLRLGQIDAPVHKGAPGVLPRPRRAGPRRDAGVDEALGHHRPAVAAQFRHVLAGVAVGRTEKQGHPVVQLAAVGHEAAVEGGVALRVFHFFGGVVWKKHLCRHRQRLLAGQAYHGDAALSRGSGQRHDGLGHEKRLLLQSRIFGYIRFILAQRRRGGKGAAARAKQKQGGALPCFARPAAR